MDELQGHSFVDRAGEYLSNAGFKYLATVDDRLGSLIFVDRDSMIAGWIH